MKYFFGILYMTSIQQMRMSFARSIYRFCLIIQPIIYTIITYIMFASSGQYNFLSYVVLGSGILSLWSTICFSTAGDIERERRSGTLELITATPTSFKFILIGKILGNTLLGLFPLLISYLTVGLGFNANFYVGNPIHFIVALILTIVSFMGISLIFSAFFTLSRSARILMNCMEYPIFILCGILFPIDILPQWTRPLSYILSPTWAVKILRLSIASDMNVNLFINYICILLFLTVTYFIVGNILLNIIDKRTRIKATLGVK